MENKWIYYGISLYILIELSTKMLANLLLLLRNTCHVNDLVLLIALIVYCLLCIYLFIFRIKRFPKLKLSLVVAVVLLFLASNFVHVLPMNTDYTDVNTVVYSIAKAIDGLFPLLFLLLSYLKYRLIKSE